MNLEKDHGVYPQGSVLLCIREARGDFWGGEGGGRKRDGTLALALIPYRLYSARMRGPWEACSASITLGKGGTGYAHVCRRKREKKRDGLGEERYKIFLARCGGKGGTWLTAKKHRHWEGGKNRLMLPT